MLQIFTTINRKGPGSKTNKLSFVQGDDVVDHTVQVWERRELVPLNVVVAKHLRSLLLCSNCVVKPSFRFRTVRFWMS